MKTVRVPCWRFVAEPGPTYVWAAYPSGDAGFDLVVCLRCGQVHAADVGAQIYLGPPLEEKLKTAACANCGACLAESGAAYPDKYRRPDGTVGTWQRPREIPRWDAELRSYPSLYEP